MDLIKAVCMAVAHIQSCTNMEDCFGPKKKNNKKKDSECRPPLDTKHRHSSMRLNGLYRFFVVVSHLPESGVQ